MDPVSPGRFCGHALGFPPVPGELLGRGEREALDHLYAFEHAMRETVNFLGIEIAPQHSPRPTRTFPCVEPGCERCRTLRGGYKFRWYSRLWESGYRACRWEDSWVAGEPEDDEVNFPPELRRSPVGEAKRFLAAAVDQGKKSGRLEEALGKVRPKANLGTSRE